MFTFAPLIKQGTMDKQKTVEFIKKIELFRGIGEAGLSSIADTVYKGFKALQAEDIADIIYFVISRPYHVNIADVLMFCRLEYYLRAN